VVRVVVRVVGVRAVVGVFGGLIWGLLGSCGGGEADSGSEGGESAIESRAGLKRRGAGKGRETWNE